MFKCIFHPICQVPRRVPRRALQLGSWYAVWNSFILFQKNQPKCSHQDSTFRRHRAQESRRDRRGHSRVQEDDSDQTRARGRAQQPRRTPPRPACVARAHKSYVEVLLWCFCGVFDQDPFLSRRAFLSHAGRSRGAGAGRRGHRGVRGGPPLRRPPRTLASK